MFKSFIFTFPCKTFSLCPHLYGKAEAGRKLECGHGVDALGEAQSVFLSCDHLLEVTSQVALIHVELCLDLSVDGGEGGQGAK